MPSLSVLCITNDPGPQVAAALAPLRAVATEIVIAADSRVGAVDLGHYAAVSDRLLRYTFDFPVERPYAWAHAQCSSDWILRIDGDEVVSPELVDELPSLLARRDRLQYWIPRRWSYPDEDHWIDERPWAPDHQLRLVRNDPALMAFDGLMHTAAQPVSPHGIATTPMYHLDLLLHSLDRRRQKAAVYETLRPGLMAPGGGPQEMYYLPEAWVSRSPAKSSAPAAALLRGVVAPVAGQIVPVDPSSVPLASRQEIDAHWDARPLAVGDHLARLELLDTDLRLAPGRPDALTICVRNDGTAPWPGGLVRSPLVRVAHRWLDAEGRALSAEHPRSPLPGPIEAGGSAVVSVLVQAPATPGEYIVEIDLVHEHVQWFERPLRVPVSVAPRRAPRII